ncbi:MAG: hypothetical protein WKF91_06790 [Segetibacter sp.]
MKKLLTLLLLFICIESIAQTSPPPPGIHLPGKRETPPPPIRKPSTSLSKDVYVAGGENTGTKGVAKYWKNGVATSLTNGTNSAHAYSVYVSGTDVYVAGRESNGTKYVAKVWKNGVAPSLTNGSNDGAAYSVLFRVPMCM